MMKIWTTLLLCYFAILIRVCLSQLVDGSGENIEVTPQLNVECLETSALVNITADVSDEVRVVLEYWDNVDRKATIDVTFDNQDDGSGEQGSEEEGSGVSPIVSSEFEMNIPNCEHCLPDTFTQSITNNKKVEDLFPNTLYRFCLVAENKKQLMCKNCSTQESVPTRHPTIMTMEAGFTFIKLGWMALTKQEQGGPHIVYKISYWEVNKPEEIHKEMVLATSHIISHLHPGTKYALELTSENTAGPSIAKPQILTTYTRKLSPPSDIVVQHRWVEDTLVANVSWSNDPTINNMADLTRRGSFIHLWKGEEGNYTLLESLNFSHIPRWMELNMTDARDQDTLLTMNSYYGMHVSNASIYHNLFYDVVAEAQANLMRLVMLIVGLVLFVLLGIVSIIFMYYCCRNLRRNGKYRTGEGDNFNTNITKTNFPVITNLQDLDKQQPLLVGSCGGASQSTVHTSSISLPPDNDELGFLYTGMDEDGSFIGDASFAINNGNNGKEVMHMWREMDAGDHKL